jgi:hypothetical protein
MKYWHAFSLANIGRVEESLPIFALVFERDEHWKILTKRLKKLGMLQVNLCYLQRLSKKYNSFIFVKFACSKIK